VKVKAGRHDRLRFSERTGLTLEYDARPGRPRKELATALAHELSHAITEKVHRHSLDPNLYASAMKGRVALHIPLMREELAAWRLAKSICKAELWDERFAVRNFLTYVVPPPYLDRFFGLSYVKRRLRQQKRLRAVGIIPRYRPVSG
jgi:hypothetical protein